MSHLWQPTSSLLILQLQRCSTCRILHQTWKHCGLSYFLCSRSWYESYLYRNQLCDLREFSYFYSAEWQHLPPSQEEQGSPGLQHHLNNVIKIFYVDMILYVSFCSHINQKFARKWVGFWIEVILSHKHIHERPMFYFSCLDLLNSFFMNRMKCACRFWRATFTHGVHFLKITSNGHQTFWWASSSRDPALVESFIRRWNIMDGHVSCRATPNEEAIFKEIGFEFRRSSFVSAVQSHIISVHHRKNRTLQDHSLTWTTRVLTTDFLYQYVFFFFLHIILPLCTVENKLSIMQ